MYYVLHTVLETFSTHNFIENLINIILCQSILQRYLIDKVNRISLIFFLIFSLGYHIHVSCIINFNSLLRWKTFIFNLINFFTLLSLIDLFEEWTLKKSILEEWYTNESKRKKGSFKTTNLLKSAKNVVNYYSKLYISSIKKNFDSC